MQIRHILQSKSSVVFTTGPDATLKQAISTLAEHHIGALVVTDERGAVVGILTERDILRECSRRPERLAETTVGEVMTRDLVIGVPDDDVDYAMGIMTHNRFRHLPIVVDGRLEGIVSIGDAVKALLEQTKYENRYLNEYILSR